MRRSVLAPSLVALLLGCGSDMPTEPVGIAADFAVAGNSGCFTVAGLIEQTGLPPLFTGIITGDIEGQVVTQIVPGEAHGRVSPSGGEQTWEVTGGSVEALIGRTVRLELESAIVFAQPPQALNSTSARVVDGAEAGNLTYHGPLDASTVPFTVSVSYRGVICP